MSKEIRLSLNAFRILKDVENAMQDAEEMGGADGTNDYLKLMLAIGKMVKERYDAANNERGCGEVGDDFVTELRK